MAGGDLCALGLPGKTIVSVLGQTSGLTNPIVTRLSEGRVDGQMSGVSATVGVFGRKLISGSEKSPTAEVYSNNEPSGRGS